jgi:hypothetical protein
MLVFSDVRTSRRSRRRRSWESAEADNERWGTPKGCNPQQFQRASVTALGSWQCVVSSHGRDSLGGELLRDTPTRRCRLGWDRSSRSAVVPLPARVAWLMPAYFVTHARDSTRLDSTQPDSTKVLVPGPAKLYSDQACSDTRK